MKRRVEKKRVYQRWGRKKCNGKRTAPSKLKTEAFVLPTPDATRGWRRFPVQLRLGPALWSWDLLALVPVWQGAVHQNGQHTEFIVLLIEEMHRRVGRRWMMIQRPETSFSDIVKIYQQLTNASGPQDHSDSPDRGDTLPTAKNQEPAFATVSSC